VAAKHALDFCRSSGIPIEIVYCDTGSEHTDNERFLADCELWLKHPITRLKSAKYRDTWSVWERRGYISGIAGAPCTAELKKALREQFEQEGDVQVFGFDADEANRVERFSSNQPEIAMWCPLLDGGIKKTHCLSHIASVGIPLPAMYVMGYANNNCIGCPKGNAGYWNKIRRDFPEVFARMARLEAKLGARICQATIGGVRRRVALSELPLHAGRHSGAPSFECGLLCVPSDSNNQSAAEL
jgi:hypothetical protein